MYKVLIVDDQYGIRVLLKEVLINEGYDVHQASNGVEALKVMEEEDPDLLLLDMKIPGMDGIDILKERKKRHLARHMIIIIMTAYGELNVMQEAKELGAAACLTKPFDINKVRDKINTLLASSST
ncbi:two-component system, response regulator, stage 0 sporulation protein F [Alteribacillus persepolensis]|uniref:Two-component system, response regulator, stage 0 sporulation protein F n=1 Tax=Alteribacillus persepolensis TaxID=568899 RepID=A0A1G8G1J7_9BACI|nr:response regulator [Alteribacillus persepolensis]SDH88284.1 two-component system, response regulator, stage 0 sporulation protein F [Alteribacillus persepolensis]